jgi:hypothetical protein
LLAVIVLVVLLGSGLLLAPRILGKLAQHTLEAVGQLNIANRTQCIDNDVEFSRTENQVEAIAIDIEQRLILGVARIFGRHGGRNYRAAPCERS